ncbi:MAG: gas vesicle protein GvpJ [Leptolyngbyaceae bacterium]|nr:gas vesicle protein GvpJ [Leptolyngbyaceae bacterium]
MTVTSPARSSPNRSFISATQGSSLADVLERVLDKGVVIAGDISVSVGSTELLSIRIRLLISSVDKAREIGVNWWEGDPYLSSQAQSLRASNEQLQSRIEGLEKELRALRSSTDEVSETVASE